MGRRRFGRVRRLPSGRFQVRYRGLDGVDRPAPRTFGNKTDANNWLTDKESELLRGEWYDPDAAAIPLDEYARRWISERPNLAARTVELYTSLYRLHLAPDLGRLGLIDITAARVRTWRKTRLDAGAPHVQTAKAYRLLKAIMNTALDDGLIRRNPCRIKGGGSERSPERPSVDVADAFAIADNIVPRYRALVLLATFASLRYGELMGLQRDDLDLAARTVKVRRAVKEVGGRQLVDEPKTWAGRRTVTIPRVIVPDLAWHLRVFAEDGDDGRLFVGSRGATPLRSNFHKYWLSALELAGVGDVRLHDLRHTGATAAAMTGATTRELMQRLGHSSPRAAMIYQHATDDRDRAIADGLDELIGQARKGSQADRSHDEDDDDPPMVGVPTGT
ncbi:site-specific integrase [Nocardioidaceae bacterium SCSIO 66511]|nr:site-specific integrase [Nocardioidaceae bacterium SCSIO 66511]